MSRMFVIGEDGLTCALGTRLVTEILGWTLAQPAVNTGGATKLKPALSRYMGLTRLHPVLCVADTDGCCALHMRSIWMPRDASADFLIRFAVTEAESWVMADRERLASFFSVSENTISNRPDEIADPKRELLNLARRSKNRLIRQEIVSSSDASKPGSGYNVHLCDFVARCWRPNEAAQLSPSLASAVKRLIELGSSQ